MDHTKRKEQIRRMITQKLSIDEKEIEYDTDLFLLEGFDSMFVVEMMMYIETEFQITIPEDMYGLDHYASVDKIDESISAIQEQIG